MTNSTAAPSIADFAQSYADEYGWAVFPCHGIENDVCTCGHADCKSPGKHPRTKNGSLDASLDNSQIDAMFDQCDLLNMNIGIATGSVSQTVVVDLDQGKGGDINELLIDGIDQTIFNTPKVKTGAGMHFYYRLPAGITVKNSASRLGKFIDIRGDGGYVIAPPSAHVSGKYYEWLNPMADGSLPPMLEFPKAWLDKLSQPLPPTNGSANGKPIPIEDYGDGIRAQVDSGIKVPDEVLLGNRNNTLIALAGKMRRGGFSEAAIYAALQRENIRICQPPLDDKEVHDIAHSAGRYAPATPIDPVSDPDAPIDSHAFYYKDFRVRQYVPKEVLALHIGKGDVAMLAGGTNTGKSTILRNILMCMAAGRPFMPFFDGARPIKTAYFDLETDGEDLQRDTAIMEKVFTPTEMRFLEENLIVVPRHILNGHLFQFNTHEQWINSLIKQEEIEFVVVDNVSAAFDLRDENSGSEVTKKVMKPLSTLAMEGHCGIGFAHHFGKAKVDPDETGVHAGRGTSSFGNLSRTVFNMYGDVSKGEPSTVICAKRKTDGGQSYKEVFKLKDDRWFHATTIVSPPRAKSCMEAIVDFLKAQGWRKTPVKDILNELEKNYHRATIFRTLKDGQRIKMIETANGRYWLTGTDDDDEEN